MTGFDQSRRIESYKRQRPTITGNWMVGDFEISGGLSWDGDRPILKLNYFANTKELKGQEVEKLSVLKALSAPNRTEITGFTHALGHITLMTCVLVHHRVAYHSHSPSDISADIELHLMPHQIWMNSAGFDFSNV